MINYQNASHGQALDIGKSMTTEKKFLDSLQIGRAFAALAVALQHAIYDADRYYPRYTGENPAFTADPEGWVALLAAGVDIFFIISGVVMVLSTQRSKISIGTFLYRRAARIFPLWWLLTLAYIAVLIVAPGLFQISYFDPVHATCSMLLIPCIGPDEQAIPLIYAGWTLTYELVFYGLFAASLLAPGRIGKIVVCILLVLLWHSLHYTSLATMPAIFHSTGNIMLEFIFGVLLAHFWLSFDFARKAGFPLIATGVVLLIVSKGTLMLGLPRFLQWGVPALCMVAGLMCLNQPRAKQHLSFRFLVHLGAASYSLYLFHLFSLKLYYVGLGKIGLLAKIPAEVAVVGGLLITILASILVYRVCELRLQRLSKLLLGRWQKES
jgi:exopolysaccharide production protein ExoZ